MKTSTVSITALLLLAATILSGCVVSAALLSIAPVSAPAINCVYDDDCTITVNDLTSTFTPPHGSGEGFLQSRLFPRGEVNTQAAGLYGYLYRIDLRNTAGVTALSCVTSFSIEFGPVVALDYDGDGALDNAFVVTGGGLGSVEPTAVDKADDIVTFTFEPAICPGSQIGGGESSYFFGLTSVFPAKDVTAQLAGSLGLSESLAARAPDFVSSADNQPTLVVAPNIGKPLQTITVSGSGFTPGGYQGTILWDEIEVQLFDIPDGGAFQQQIVVPTDIVAGEHMIAVCSLNPCATGEFQQLATTAFEVTTDESAIIVWHAWSGAAEERLKQLNFDQYQELEVEFIRFGSQSELLEKVSGLGTPSSGPDLILGPDAWGENLLDSGLANAYCLPGECPACESSNPPRWCQTAHGDFGESFNPDFMIAGLCADSGDCPCQGTNPPRWCWAAMLQPESIPEGGIDIFQAGFARQFQGSVLPIGIPISWDFPMVVANPVWFAEHDLPIPESVDTIINLTLEYEELLRFLDPGFIDPLPEPFQRLVDVAKGDPSPQPSKHGLLLTNASELPGLRQEFATLFMLPLADYLPEPDTQGLFVNPMTINRVQALNAAYTIAGLDMQVGLAQSTHALPAHGTGWETVADPILRNLGDQSLLGFINALPALPDFRETPSDERPFGDDDCGVAAQESFDRLNESGLSQFEVWRLQFDLTLKVNSCRIRMPDYGADFCGQQAERAFAQTFMENRPQAETAGLSRLESCRNAMRLIRPDAGGGDSWPIPSGLGVTLAFPPDALAESLDLFVLDESDLGENPPTDHVVGSIFSVNAFKTGTMEEVTEFANPFQLIVTYDQIDLADADEANLALFFWATDAGMWVELSGELDTESDTIEVALNHLTTFAIRERNSVVYLPIVTR